MFLIQISMMYYELTEYGYITRNFLNFIYLSIQPCFDSLYKRQDQNILLIFCRSEGAYDEVDLEPIKLRELPPIPPIEEGVTYASLSLPLDPPSHPTTTVMKDNELYQVNEGLQV